MYLRYPLSCSLFCSFILIAMYLCQTSRNYNFVSFSLNWICCVIRFQLITSAKRKKIKKRTHTFEYWIQEIGSQLKSSSLLERFCFMLLNSFAQSVYYNLQINGSNEHVGRERTGVKMVSKKFNGANITNEMNKFIVYTQFCGAFNRLAPMKLERVFFLYQGNSWPHYKERLNKYDRNEKDLILCTTFFLEQKDRKNKSHSIYLKIFGVFCRILNF